MYTYYIPTYTCYIIYVRKHCVRITYIICTMYVTWCVYKYICIYVYRCASRSFYRGRKKRRWRVWRDFLLARIHVCARGGAIAAPEECTARDGWPVVTQGTVMVRAGRRRGGGRKLRRRRLRAACAERKQNIIQSNVAPGRTYVSPSQHSRGRTSCKNVFQQAVFIVEHVPGKRHHLLPVII